MNNTNKPINVTTKITRELLIKVLNESTKTNRSNAIKDLLIKYFELKHEVELLRSNKPEPIPPPKVLSLSERLNNITN